MYNRYPRTLEIKFLNRNNIIFELQDRLLMVSLNLRKPKRLTWEVKVYLTLCTQWGHVREWWYSSICSYPRHRPLYPCERAPLSVAQEIVWAPMEASDYERSLVQADIFRPTNSYPAIPAFLPCLMQKVRRHAGAQLVETLRYKQGGRGLDSQWYH